ncbi:hypothetical protein ORJ04_18150 [Rheinheimera baltica]|uniref:Uncharacterized protein n=1 Tax=Rheinheimera baltica TaxID=67576 RepID=A0ABT9I3D7_9GAMM|nr:hypothetical protein [Rheinheimera baltica]MDP5137878.1 hypothetical protein [Rheinheimera baltica]MDP5149761.1 hypothetical protein [Rheinheimera baltica]
MKKILAAAALAIGLSGIAQAEIVMLPWAKINFSTLDSNNYGGCMIRIDQRIDGLTGGQCKSLSNGAFLVFSCTGELQDYDIANKLFDTAQMAQVLNKNVRLYVDTNLRHNGFCTVNRLDIE